MADESSVYERYTQARAATSQQSVEVVLATTTPVAFYRKLLALYQEYQTAECSFGYMAEQLGVSYFALTDILNALGLRATQGE